MRNVLLMALVGVMLSGVPVWAQQAGQKASEGEAAAPAPGAPAADTPAEAAPAKVEDAEPAAGEQKKEAEPGDSQKEPAQDAPKPAEPQVEGAPVVLESEGTGPVAAFWFVVPGRS